MIPYLTPCAHRFLAERVEMLYWRGLSFKDALRQVQERHNGRMN